MHTTNIIILKGNNELLRNFNLLYVSYLKEFELHFYLNSE